MVGSTSWVGSQDLPVVIGAIQRTVMTMHNFKYVDGLTPLAMIAAANHYAPVRNVLVQFFFVFHETAPVLS
jgi:hypothetical protein